MIDYTKLQKEYIDSVGGEAHNSAMVIIGKLEKEIYTLETIIENTKAALINNEHMRREKHIKSIKEIDCLEKEVIRYRETLEAIRDADYKTWGEEFKDDPQSFVDWAKSRARHVLNGGE